MRSQGIEPGRVSKKAGSLAVTPFRNSKAAPGRTKLPDPQGPVEKFGVLQPQEVLLGLFGEYVGNSERAWSGGLVQLLGELGFSGAASRIAMTRVVSRGLLATEKEGRFVFYTITPRLQLVHKEGRYQTFSPVIDVEWSGDWTFVWYNVPEEQRIERGRLGRWLNLRGFGSLQDGTWLCAGNREVQVLELAKRLGLDRHVIVLVGKLGAGIETRSVAERAWRLTDLTTMYDTFVEEFRPYAIEGHISKLDARQCFVLRTRLIEMFRQTTIHDPRLPDTALSIDWRRGEAIRLFQTLQVALLEGASAHFRSVVVTGH